MPLYGAAMTATAYSRGRSNAQSTATRDEELLNKRWSKSGKQIRVALLLPVSEGGARDEAPGLEALGSVNGRATLMISMLVVDDVRLECFHLAVRHKPSQAALAGTGWLPTVKACI
jgi:hypothetical protein